MEQNFTRTLRSLQSERSRQMLWMSALALCMLAAWGWWFARAGLTLYASSTQARLESALSVRPVACLRPGRVTAVHVAIGEEVEQGQVLIELDARELELSAAEVSAQVPALEARQTALARAALEAEQRLSTMEQAGQSELAELAAWIVRAGATQQTATDEAARSELLHAQGLVTDAEALRLQQHALGEESQLLALQHQRERRRLEQVERLAEARADFEELRAELAEAQGVLAQARATLERLEHEQREHRILAPCAGRIGSLADHRAGSTVLANEVLASVIPAAPLQIVADFAVAEASGRLAAGQRARLKLDAFPWSRYGSLVAEVRAVAWQSLAGVVRVELELVDAEGFSVPLQHGMSGSLEVAVEELTPVALVLRSIGRALASTTPVEQP